MTSSPSLATPVHRLRGRQAAALTAAVAAAHAALETATRWEYDQECARSAAEATGIDAWGAVARERLHEAICAVRQARADLIAAQAAEHAGIGS